MQNKSGYMQIAYACIYLKNFGNYNNNPTFCNENGDYTMLIVDDRTNYLGYDCVATFDKKYQELLPISDKIPFLIQFVSLYGSFFNDSLKLLKESWDRKMVFVPINYEKGIRQLLKDNNPFDFFLKTKHKDGVNSINDFGLTPLFTTFLFKKVNGKLLCANCLLNEAYIVKRLFNKFKKQFIEDYDKTDSLPYPFAKINPNTREIVEPLDTHINCFIKSVENETIQNNVIQYHSSSLHDLGKLDIRIQSKACDDEYDNMSPCKTVIKSIQHDMSSHILLMRQHMIGCFYDDDLIFSLNYTDLHHDNMDYLKCSNQNLNNTFCIITDNHFNKYINTTGKKIKHGISSKEKCFHIFYNSLTSRIIRLTLRSQVVNNPIFQDYLIRYKKCDRH